MPLFSFKTLKKAYRQVKFNEKLNSLISNFYQDIDQAVFLFATNNEIKTELTKLLESVNKLITKYKMDEKSHAIVEHVKGLATKHVNRYIENNIDYLPNRSRNQSLPF